VRPADAPAPFPATLRSAIADSGLTLDRILERLRARGVSLSVSTLSLWQTGRCRPERIDSLRALAVLEEVLNVSAGGLSALLGAPRPRGRHLPDRAKAAPGLAETWRSTPEASPWDDVDTRWDATLTRLSSHSRLTVDAERCERSLWSRRLLRAEVEGADRWIVVGRTDPAGPPPDLQAGPGCRVGRVVHVAQEGLLVAELLFGHRLARGETALVEYALHYAPGLRPSTRFGARLHRATRERLVEVCFDPAARPRRCCAYRSSSLDAAPRERALRLDRTGSVHAVALGAGPGRFGIRWEWD
jgi:transcriptional regulator with XRE-family HTH domain